MWTDSDIVIEWVCKKRRGEYLLKHGERKDSIYVSHDLWVCKRSFWVMIYFSFLKGCVVCLVFIWCSGYLTKIAAGSLSLLFTCWAGAGQKRFVLLKAVALKWIKWTQVHPEAGLPLGILAPELWRHAPPLLGLSSVSSVYQGGSGGGIYRWCQRQHQGCCRAQSGEFNVH